MFQMPDSATLNKIRNYVVSENHVNKRCTLMLYEGLNLQRVFQRNFGIGAGISHIIAAIMQASQCHPVKRLAIFQNIARYLTSQIRQHIKKAQVL
jgi:hypothetical protein